VYTSTELVVTGTTVKGKRPYYEREQKQDRGTCTNTLCSTDLGLDPDHEGSSDTLDENDHAMVDLNWCILINDTVAF